MTPGTTSHRVDVAVLGAGPAGAGAAIAAAAAGRSVLLIDEAPAAGGQIYRKMPDTLGPASPGTGDSDPDRCAGDALRRELHGSTAQTAFGWRVWSAMPVERGFRLDAIGAGAPHAVEAPALLIATGAVERILAISRMDDAGGVRSGRCDHDAEVPAHLARPTGRGRRCRAASGGGGGRCAEGRSRGRGSGRSQWSRGLARRGARPGVAPAARPARGRLGAGAVAGRRAHPVSCKGRARARRRTPGGGGDRRRGRQDWDADRARRQSGSTRTHSASATASRPRPSSPGCCAPSASSTVPWAAGGRKSMHSAGPAYPVCTLRETEPGILGGQAALIAGRIAGAAVAADVRGAGLDRAYGMVRLARTAVRRGDDPTDCDEFRCRGARFRPRQSSAAART